MKMLLDAAKGVGFLGAMAVGLLVYYAMSVQGLAIGREISAV
jgi:hypothetical protein